MERAGKLILGALRRVAGSEQPLDFLTALWPVIVGARLAEHARPMEWERGWLKIAVADLEWQQQLERMPETVRGRINKWWGANVVDEITFVRGKVGQSASLQARPKVGPSKAPRPAEAGVDELNEALGRIRDPEFRDLVKRVAAKYIGGAKEK